MAITFPRDFPYDGAFSEECSFTPVYQQSLSISGGIGPNVADLGPAMWRGEFATVALDREKWGQWVAWLHSMRGGLRTFRGRPPLWKWPIAYPRGFGALTYLGGPWSGSGNLSVIGGSRDTVTVNQIPNGLTLKPGDFFSIPVGSRQHLHRIIEGGVAAGNALSLTVEPTIRPGVATGIAVKFEAPYCEMVLIGEPKMSRRGTRGGSISFIGQQVLI